MDIITFAEGLQARIREMGPPGNDQDDLIRTSQRLRQIREIIDELKEFTIAYTFVNLEEEIRFFKEIKPVLLSQYFFYKRMFPIQLFDSFSDAKTRMDNYGHILQKLQHFARKNEPFYQYCMSGETYLDSSYFTLNKKKLQHFDIDSKFTTGFDTKLAKILGHELIKKFVIDALHKLQVDRTQSPMTTLPWTDSKVALVELVYALHAAGVFNRGKVDLKQIVHCFETTFSIELGNYARVFSEIQIRKSGQTNFLDYLRERFLTLTNSP